MSLVSWELMVVGAFIAGWVLNEMVSGAVDVYVRWARRRRASRGHRPVP